MAMAPVDGEEPDVASIAPVPSYTVVKVEAEHSQQALVSLIGFFNKRNIPVVSLEILEPNLESVFLHLTGKKLRE
jgi:ABC-2 type transport system ATP-binding protein